MSIATQLKRNNRLYRKLWSEAHGPIPKDSNGRSLEIHHINGDHSDNRLDNLKLVSIEEHYQIHYAQEDYYAAVLIAMRMKISPEELSELRVKSLKKLAAEGRHPFQNKEMAKARNKKLFSEGKHIFQTNHPVHQQVLNGNHSARIKISCLVCKNVTSLSAYKQHSNACKRKFDLMTRTV